MTILFTLTLFLHYKARLKSYCIGIHLLGLITPHLEKQRNKSVYIYIIKISKKIALSYHFARIFEVEIELLHTKNGDKCNKRTKCHIVRTRLGKT